ncbi:hypothetical protein CHARACLAT_022093 [Characodon lateralis]|uniref:Uncharacterized protein n=1 Tax=Characodon lateralis TaxID=208331 RepID=A0ABU7D8X3_9TELE|nr:hypothetical protein [Characodon lateralis]
MKTKELSKGYGWHVNPHSCSPSRLISRSLRGGDQASDLLSWTSVLCLHPPMLCHHLHLPLETNRNVPSWIPSLNSNSDKQSLTHQC